MNSKKKSSKINVGKKAQVSLEYLLIVSAFFSALLIIIPSVSIVTNDFLLANDAILIKQISEKVVEQEQLFLFLSNGSRKEFVFVPAREINLKTINNSLILSNPKKSLTISLSSKQNLLEQKFESKFKIIIEKQNNETLINFQNIN